MEKAKISGYQMFALILLFVYGGPVLLPIGVGAGRDAWLAFFLGMIGGLVLFLIFYLLFTLYPNELPVMYDLAIMGKWLGSFIAILYILYFIFLASVNLRYLGEMLVDVGYSRTPLWALTLIMFLAVTYTIRKGIETIARAGEIFFIFLVIIIGSLLVILLFGNTIDFRNLLPIMENGIQPVLIETVKHTLYVPFGEIVVFSVLFPYINNRKKVKAMGFSAFIISGITLTLFVIINISVLGVALDTRSSFPLLSTIQTIKIADYLARLDIYFVLILIISGFFRITIYYYAAVVCAVDLFKVKRTSFLIYPIGIVIYLFASFWMTNFIEYMEFLRYTVPMYIFLPLQLIIPAFLLVVAFGKRKIGNEQVNK